MRFLKEKTIYFVSDLLWHYTFWAILLKSLILLGFMLGENHARTDLRRAYEDMPSFLAYSCFIILFLSFSYLFRGRRHLWYLLLCNLFFSLLLLTDLWYFRGFGTFVSVHVLQQSANLDNLSGSIVSMARSADIIFILDLLILLPASLFLRKPYQRTGRNIFLFALMAVICTGYIGYRHYKLDIVENGSNQIFFRICWTPNQTITNLSPLGYHIYDTYKYIEERQPLRLKPEERKDIRSWFDNKIENLPDNSYQGLFKGKNLIVIQVESLENFVIGQKINGKEITPNLNKLLQNSLYFSEFHEQVNEGTSSDADFLTNTSVYPVQRGSTFFRYPDNTYASLPKLLQKQGYSTHAVYPMKGAFWNWMEAMKSIGFENCLDIAHFTVDEYIGLGISDGSYLRQISPYIRELQEPFHIHIVTLTSHGPFDIPWNYRELELEPRLDQTKLGGYFESVHYTDKQIGAFLSGLEAEGKLDHTVVAIYGDHTGIHKYYADELAEIQPYEDWWTQPDPKVPLILYSKELEGREIKVRGGQIDTLPTLAYLMGIEEEEYLHTAMGRNLLKTEKDFAVLVDGKFIGSAADEKEKETAVKGLEIADEVVRSNYFMPGE